MFRLSEERVAVQIESKLQHLVESESIGFALVLGIAVALCKPVALAAL